MDIGALTQGQVVALVNYMAQILVELVKLANLIVQLTKALACADCIQKVFETKASMSDGELTDIETSMPEGEVIDIETSTPEGEVTDVETSTPDGGAVDTAAADRAGVPYIEFDHVSLAYAGAGENSLTDISFSVKKGETVGIIGGTGSGKSSLSQNLKFVNISPDIF